MAEEKSGDWISKVEWLILRIALILFLLIGIAEVLKAKLVALWH